MKDSTKAWMLTEMQWEFSKQKDIIREFFIANAEMQQAIAKVIIKPPHPSRIIRSCKRNVNY